MQVGLVGNVCKACYDRTPYTDSIENVEVYELMDKLSFPCNYTEKGCTFFGSFRKTCKHEECCYFRGRLCPFVYTNKCDTNEYIHDIISHIQEQHNDNIVVVEEECITVKNASLARPDELYYVNISGNSFLIRSVFKKESYEILYMFYRMNDNDMAKAVVFTSIAFNEMQEKCVVMSESELSFELGTKNAIAVDNQKLEDLDFQTEIKILVKRNYDECGDVPVVPTVWWQCRKCLNTMQEIHLPREILDYLSNYNCKCSLLHAGSDKTVKIDVSKLQIGFVFPCNSESCHQLIRGDNYYAHKAYQCHFVKHKCQIKICWKKYFSHEMIAHILEKHKDVLNPKMCFLNTSKSPIRYVFFNNDDVFVQESFLCSDNIFSTTIIKLTEPYWDNSYYWEVHIQPKTKTMPTVIVGDSAVIGRRKEIQVKEYLENNELAFTTYIKRV